MGLVRYYKGSFRQIADNIFTPTGQAIAGMGITPNHLTAMQFPLAALSAYFLYTKNIETGTLFLVFALFFDGLDGLVARVSNQETRNGHLFDKAADMFGICAFLFGIAFYSPFTLKLVIASAGINLGLYITNEMRGPFFYSAIRDAGIIGLILYNSTSSVAPLNFWLIVSICLGSFMLLAKTWMMLSDLVRPRV